MKGNHADTHRFLTSDVSITDESLFDLSAIHGHHQLTDLYLLGLCHRHGARLVTFDSAIAALLRNVHGGTPYDALRPHRLNRHFLGEIPDLPFRVLTSAEAAKHLT
jgi:hypothetical protein